jgi:tRNA (cytidine56-2'-O)-methyltransferase
LILVPVQDKIEEIRKSESNKLVVVGAEKVPREIFDLADHNVSVTQQPHSEAAALAVFLHMFFNGEELYKKFSNARLSVEPQERGKVVVEAA